MKKHAAVYVIDLGEGAVKIGHSKKPQKRRKELKLDHCEFGYISKVYEEAELVERAAHKILQGEKIYGETFRVSVEQACEAIAAAEQLIYGGLQPDDYIPPIIPLKRPPVSVRLTKANRAWLNKLAKRENRSLNYLINRCVTLARLATPIKQDCGA